VKETSAEIILVNKLLTSLQLFSKTGEKQSQTVSRCQSC